MRIFILLFACVLAMFAGLGDATAQPVACGELAKLIDADLAALAVDPINPAQGVSIVNAQAQLSGYLDCKLMRTHMQGENSVTYRCKRDASPKKPAGKRQSVVDEILASTKIDTCLKGWKRSVENIGPEAHIVLFKKGDNEISFGISEDEDKDTFAWDNNIDVIHQLKK